MATRHDMRNWVIEALKSSGGSASLVEVCKHIWAHHKDDLERSGDLFYTWQYDVRWAATTLRKAGIIRSSEDSPRGIWELIT